MDLRIALVVVSKYDGIGCAEGEELFTRFCKPERLMQELAVIQDQPSWEIKETYIANSYGMRIETKGGD